MVKERFFAKKLGVTLFAIVILSACGSSPGSSEINSSENSSQKTKRQLLQDAAPVNDEERLRQDPSCADLSAEFSPVVEKIIDRFNTMVLPASRPDNIALVSAGHPDGGSGVSVRICADKKVAAYAYPSTIGVHEGLLSLLKNAAYSSTAGWSQRGQRARLDEIVRDSLEGRSEGGLTSWEKLLVNSDPALSQKAEELFEAGAAFVIYHELGHSQMERNRVETSPVKTDGTDELRADIFSSGSMAAAGFSMEGADLVFSILERVSPEGSLGHPDTGERFLIITRSGGKNLAGMLD